MNKTLKADNFIYWLQGFFEISEATTLNEKQINIIKEHLELCFEKVTLTPSQPSHAVPPGHAIGVSGSPFWTSISQGVGSEPITTIC